MQAQQNPGSWSVVSTGPARIPRIESEGAPVALMFQESAHHAALIAAAPDLLEALQNMLAHWNQGSFHPAVSQACDAIAKATKR